MHLVQSNQAPSQSLITICDNRPFDWTLDSSENLSVPSDNIVASLSGKLNCYILMMTVIISKQVKLNEYINLNFFLDLELNDKKFQTDSDDDFELL